MAYFFMSNINNFEDVNNIEASYQEVGIYTGEGDEPINGVINFNEQKASFLMVRAYYDNDILIQLSPSNYCVLVPAGELWSVDSINTIDKIYIRKIFDSNGESKNSGLIQWMIGYK